MLVAEVEAVEVALAARPLAGFTKRQFPAAANLLEHSRNGGGRRQVRGEFAGGTQPAVRREAGHFLREQPVPQGGENARRRRPLRAGGHRSDGGTIRQKKSLRA